MPKAPRVLWLLCASLWLSPAAIAQDTPLSLQAAWATARAQNYDLKLLQLETARFAAMATPGMAGMAPSLDAFGGANQSINNTRLALANGSTIENDAAAAYGASTGLDFNWVLWQGNAARLRYRQATGSLRSQHLRADQREVDLAAELCTAWLQLSRAQDLLAVQDSNVARSQLRLSLAQARFEGGQWSKTEVLQAAVDLKADERARLQVALQLQQAQVALAQLMAQRAALQPLRVERLPTPDTTLVLEKLWELAQATQPQLLLARNETTVAALALREAQALRMPMLSLNAGPVLNYTNNPASFVTQNRNLALAYGLNLSVPLYRGQQLKQQAAIRRMALQQRNLEAEAAELSVYNRLMSAWQGYRAAIAQLQLERDVVQSAAENRSLAEDRYRLGRSTQLDLRQAQLALVQAQAAELEARYLVWLFHTELLRLAGTLPDTLQ